MLDPTLLAEAARRLETPFTPTQEGERAAISASVAASLRLEGIDATPESVLEAADANTDADETIWPLAS